MPKESDHHMLNGIADEQNIIDEYRRACHKMEQGDFLNEVLNLTAWVNSWVVDPMEITMGMLSKH